MAKRPDGPGQRLASTLRDVRDELGWTQERLADEAGISRASIIRFESGSASNPEADSLRKVCAATGLDMRELLIDLGYLTREEVGLPPKAPELPIVLRNITAILRMKDLSEKAKVALLKHVQASVDLWADTFEVKQPIKEPSAAERAGRKPAKR